MFIVANLLISIAKILDMLFSIISWLIIIRALISWVNPDPYNPIVQFLYKTTEPILQPIRKFLPFSWTIGIDFSPFIAILLLFFLRSFLIQTLIDIGMRIH